jgi:voltage-gated potassium channel
MSAGATSVRYEPGMDARSTRIARILDPPMLLASALTIPAVAINESHPGGALEAFAQTLNWVIWVAFAFELMVMLAVVPQRRTWLRHHPLDLVIVLLTPPILPPGMQGLRVLRLLRLLRLLRFAEVSRQVFSLRGLHYAALLAVLTTIAGGALFVGFEKQNQHLNAWDGIYWAVTSMTTLGSSIYPTTTGGQIVAVAVVIVGISFVALLTGAIAQRFLGPEISEAQARMESGEGSPQAEAIRQLEEIQSQINALQVSVSRMVEGSKPSSR